MVVLAIHLDELRVEVAADCREDVSQAIEGGPVEYVAPVLGHEDQVHVHLEDAVPTRVAVGRTVS